jgi:hypothetical protein
MDRRFSPWASYKPNANEFVFLETKQIFHCIMCHSILLGAHALGLKTRGRKGLVSHKTKNGTSTMKKHCEGEHFNIWKVYVNEIHSNILPKLILLENKIPKFKKW